MAFHSVKLSERRNSPKSFEDAVQLGLTRAAKTLRGIQSAWIKEQRVRVYWGRLLFPWAANACAILSPSE